MSFKITKPALVIFLIYLIIGFLYIFFSDSLVLQWFADSERITDIQTYKGWGFIIITGIVIALLINKEILKRNRVNEILAESRELYRMLYSHLQDSLLVLNDSLQIIRCNPAFIATFGFTEEEVVRRELKDLFFNMAEFKTFSNNSDYSVSKRTYQLLTKAGGLVYAELDMAVLKGDLKNEQRYLLQIRDVTAQKIAVRETMVSQKRLLRAERVAGTGNWEETGNSQIMELSIGFMEVFGLSKKTITITELREMVLPEHLPELINAFENLKENHQSVNIGYTIARADDGAIRNIRMNCEFDEELKIRFGVVQDITELTRAEERFKHYIENSTIPVFIADTFGKFSFANPATCSMLGLQPGELKGKRLQEFVVLGNEEIQRFFENSGVGSIRSNEIQLRCHDEKVVDVSVDLIWIEESEVLGFCRDITELKNTQRKLKEKNEEYVLLNKELAESLVISREMNEALVLAKLRAEENDRLKTAFLNNMSHEIRTPMNGIIGFSGLLADKELSKEKKKHYASIIKASSEQLLHIIDDILDISRLEAGQILLNETPYSLNQLLDIVIAIAGNLISTKGKQIVIQQEKGLPDGADVFTGDKNRIAQIMNNLVNNAVKYTPQGNVTVGYKLERNEIVLFVKDTGIGIAQNQQKIIFERFRQADESVQMMAGGTGLGLSIVKGFAELMGGSVEVESVHGQGSTFFVRLPVRR